MKYLLVLAAFFCGLYSAYAQEPTTVNYSYIIKPKKVFLRYKHRKPDSLVIPVVSKRYPELRAALCDTSLFGGDRVDSVVKQYKETGAGIISFSYDVFFINKDIISLKMYTEGMGAHPSTSQGWRTLNIHTGKAHPIRSEINTAGLKWIYSNYIALLRKRIAADKAGRLKNKKESDEYDAPRIYKELRESIDTISFNGMLNTYIFTDKGIVFTTEGILPYAIQAFEIDRDWFIPYDKLMPYRLPGALVIRKRK